MKFFAATLLLATAALATPAPVADAAPAAQPNQIESLAQLSEALAARDAAHVVPEIVARTAGIRLDSRKSGKGGKGGKGGDGNSTEDSAAGMLSPSHALELGALGLGIMEVVRLWL
ncbi:hypothetical protein BDV95DRAFT_8167 [Massariosphaeria phaeospora]|uniref:Uncharacterized protein n=1 Tax=Massariosphaeria phaeospora TaxID=100035 RepID=A0A7C8MDR8_9PLEO|nr:hypothetical protein BDV95DRAFT_8167 [Massariosphaeria phaeospora]